jgi:hypothetical protein
MKEVQNGPPSPCQVLVSDCAFFIVTGEMDVIEEGDGWRGGGGQARVRVRGRKIPVLRQM